MIVRMNLGLAGAHDADLSTEEVHNLIFLAISPYADLLDSREVISSGGDWDPEPVYWAEIEVFPNEVKEFKLALESLCVVLHEDCISVAIMSPMSRIGTGTMIWNPRYEGEKFEFNLDYFSE